MTEAATQLDVNGIRTILAEDIQRLRDEKTTASALNATVNAVGKILTTVKMEMEYAKLIGVTPKIDFINVTPLKKPAALPDKSGDDAKG